MNEVFKPGAARYPAPTIPEAPPPRRRSLVGQARARRGAGRRGDLRLGEVREPRPVDRRSAELRPFRAPAANRARGGGDARRHAADYRRARNGDAVRDRDHQDPDRRQLADRSDSPKARPSRPATSSPRSIHAPMRRRWSRRRGNWPRTRRCSPRRRATSPAMNRSTSRIRSPSSRSTTRRRWSPRTRRRSLPTRRRSRRPSSTSPTPTSSRRSRGGSA